ncbi:UMP-CMP kinase 2, mitochondrial [Dunckerocampus dactyliophorus]|uniref:UMP-CMP kinase 2, mitochondrial n=1 Tax=Dunckerocampus dactyliophorus TaxID=161453 RepID=UPI002406C82A|nr:UMP-CMP kinase 2, mitochondrial [Dunckerocampus dactyliophorus]
MQMSRRSMALVPLWSSRVFSVDVDGGPVYFQIQNKHPGRGGKAVKRLFDTSMQKDGMCYSLLVSSDDKIRKAKFYWELEEKLLGELPPQCCLSPMCSFLPGVKDSLINGYFVKDAPLATERLLRQFVQRDDPVLVCSYMSDEEKEDGPLWTQHLWTHAQNHYIVPAEPPQYHPATLNMVNSDVFYSVQEACAVLKKCADIIPEATSVLELLPRSGGGGVEARSEPDFPVIVVEGLDATGKTTLTESLRDALGATLLQSPPQCLSPWRARFAQEPPIILRAFYAVGNYITAQQIVHQASKKPVIVDRFWHSTAAYAIGTAVSGSVCDLPAEGSELYHWPSDLLQPSLVILLTLDPEERKKRLQGRGQGKTKEENELEQNQQFRLRVEEAYRRISGPTCISVDASSSAEQVLQQVLLLIKAKCHL